MSEAPPQLAALRAQQAALGEQIAEIERASAHEATARYVGRFFKVMNCYYCPKTDADYWPLYFKVTGNDGRYVQGFKFQRDNEGRCSTEVVRHAFIEGHRYEEISSGEWELAWGRFLEGLMLDGAGAALDWTTHDAADDAQGETADV